MSAERAVTEASSPETAQRVLRFLMNHQREGIAIASIRDLGVELSIGRSTAHRALARLVREGRLKVARRGSGHLYPTAYYVDPGT